MYVRVQRAVLVVIAPVLALVLAPGPAYAAPLTLGVIAAGGSHSCGLTMVGEVYCWGSNAFGQLGDGNAPVDRSSAGPVVTSGALAGVPIVQVEAGGVHTCALDVEGRVYCWGDNGDGQLGTGGPGSGSDVPVRVTALAGREVVKMALGIAHTCALDSAGAVLCWGDDGDGQLGDGPALSGQDEPVEVSVDLSSSLHGKTVIDIAVHRRNTCAVDDEGFVHCWGDDQSGQLGDGGAAVDEPEPVAVSTAGVLSGKQLDQVDVGGDFACALDSDGAVFCWGENSAGQLGDDNLGVDSSVPVAVSIDSTSSLHGAEVRQVNAGDAYACAVDTDGVAHCWGENGAGQVGNGAAPADAARPYAVGGVLAGKGEQILDIDATFEHTCAITFQAAAYCWGANGNGQLGDGTLTASDRPVRVRGLPEPPDPPTHLKATGGDRSLRVSWRAPADLGTGELTGYGAVARPAGMNVEKTGLARAGTIRAEAGATAATLRALARADGGGFCLTTGATSCIIGGLTNGHTYQVYAITMTTEGTSTLSEPVIGRAGAAGAGAGLPVTGRATRSYVIVGLVLVATGAALYAVRPPRWTRRRRSSSEVG